MSFLQTFIQINNKCKNCYTKLLKNQQKYIFCCNFWICSYSKFWEMDLDLDPGTSKMWIQCGSESETLDWGAEEPISLFLIHDFFRSFKRNNSKRCIHWPSMVSGWAVKSEVLRTKRVSSMTSVILSPRLAGPVFDPPPAPPTWINWNKAIDNVI